MAGLPTVTVKLDDPSNGGTFPYDISSYVRLPDQLRIVRGRGDEQSEITSSTLNLVLENTDGRFTLGSTSGGYGTINVNRQLQVTFTVGSTSVKRFTGFVQDWPVEWPDGSESFAVAAITVTDSFARFARRDLQSVVRQEILRVPGLVGVYPLNEPAGSKAASSVVGPLAPMAQTPAGVTFGTAGLPTGAETSLSAGAGFLWCDGEAPVVSTGAKYVGVWFKTTTGGGVMFMVGGDYSTTDGVRLELTGAGAVRSMQAFGGASTITSAAWGFNDDAWHLAILADNGVSGSTLYVDGVNQGGGSTYTFDLGYHVLAAYFGYVGKLQYGFWGVGLLTAQMAADIYTAGVTGFAGDRSDSRIARLAAYVGVTASALEVGEQACPFRDFTGSKVLSEIMALAQAEGGLAFIGGDGRMVVQNRRHRESATLNQVAVDANVLEPGSRFTADMQQVVNYAEGTRFGGDSFKQVAQNAASIAVHEQYPQSYDGLLKQTDAEVRDFLDYLVSKRSQPAGRMPSAIVDLLSQTQAVQLAFLQAEISDRLTVTGLPSQTPGGTTADMHVEGWTETLTHDAWSLELNTSPYSFSQVWLVGDATRGVLDGTTILGY